eukprot:1189076-Prorocentrum_minimum.AAC.3
MTCAAAEAPDRGLEFDLGVSYIDVPIEQSLTITNLTKLPVVYKWHPSTLLGAWHPEAMTVEMSPDHGDLDPAGKFTPRGAEFTLFGGDFTPRGGDFTPRGAELSSDHGDLDPAGNQSPTNTYGGVPKSSFLLFPLKASVECSYKHEELTESFNSRMNRFFVCSEEPIHSSNLQPGACKTT